MIDDMNHLHYEAKFFGIGIPELLRRQQEAQTKKMRDKLDEKPKSILKEAEEVIYGDREKTYGDPGRNLRIVADYWNTYLISKGFDFLEGLDYDDVCNMMVLLKVARLANSPMHRDSLVDVCGYLALAERIKDADQREEKVFDTSSS